jgi:hypothetical protein
MLAGSILAVFMYYGIVLDSSGVQSSQRYLFGYGLVIPVSIWLPFQIIESFDIRGVGFRLGLVSLPMTVTLRCLESMYGFVGSGRNSLWDYVLGSGMIVKPCYDQDGKVVPLTAQRFGVAFHYHASWLLFFTVLYHIFKPFDYFPFATTFESNQVWVSFDIGHLYNTFIQAFLISSTLAFSVSGVGMLAALYTGVYFDSYITNNPILLSTSPSDFWGRRWNKLIHTGLKQGVYKPVRWHTGNRFLASIAAFTVSGIYHEYVWRLLFIATSAQLAEGMRPEAPACCMTCYCYGWAGKQMVFFCWNGVLIALEYLIGDRVGEVTKPLPQWLRSHLVVLLSLPVGHLFTADLTRSGYFESIQQALPVFLFSKIVR